jgi:hypothetical protein
MSENNGLPVNVPGANPPEEGARTSAYADDALDPQDQPAAGGAEAGDSAQGDGAPDSH